MSRNPFLLILLVAAMFAQSVIAGWGHSHAHIAAGTHVRHDVARHVHHSHAAGGQHHVHESHEHQPLPHRHVDTEDCAICRHLALAAILTLELESPTTGDATETAPDRKLLFGSAKAVGLYRPRAPPTLS